MTATATDTHESLSVRVAGGALHVGAWGTGEVIALALHGVTFTHAEFDLLGRELAGSGRLLAPDLRGRGGSAGLGPPHGLDAHVADVAEVLRRHARAPIVLIGHSWGAAVALALAHRHPELVRSLILVDGGLPAPRGPESEKATRQSIDRVSERLGKTFASVEEYLAIWRVHLGLRPYWNDCIEQTFAYELIGEASALRCSLRADALTADLVSTYVEGDAVERALLDLTHRAVLVRTARNMADEEHAQYPDEVVAQWRGRAPLLEDVFVADENHYTIILRSSGARLIADIVRKELAGPD